MMQYTTIAKAKKVTHSKEKSFPLHTAIHPPARYQTPLDYQTVTEMKPRFRRDLSQVRVHPNTPATSQEVLRKTDAAEMPAGLPCNLTTDRGHPTGVNLLFSQSSSKINDTHKELIDQFARQWIDGGSESDIEVDGYASIDGPQELNWRLSCQRAERVKNRLAEKSIPSGRIATIAHGESTEFSSGSLSQNRRVVISTVQRQPREQTEPLPPVSPSASGKYVATLCHRDFTGAFGAFVPARHCFVWGHLNTVQSDPINIRQSETMTYDANTSGTLDPDPIQNTKCTKTFDVDPDVVRKNYKQLCKASNYNLVSFNCCTCAYLALAAAGASLSVNDFPSENHGMALPFGSGWKKNLLENIWLNDIDEIEDVVRELDDADIYRLNLAIKAHWIKKLISGGYCTEAEGDMVIKLFQNTPISDRPTLYQHVEGHPWTGDWKSGVSVIDDDMVDALYNKQLHTLKNIINGRN